MAKIYHVLFFSFLRLLGEGSFGKVYKGNLLKHGDTKDDTPVAVKVTMPLLK